MPRTDANPIALRAIRAILEADPPAELQVAGQKVLVRAERLTSAWPGPLDELDEQRDGPWPPSVRIACRWDEGRIALLVSARYWRPNEDKKHRVGLRIGVDGVDQELVWITVANSLLEGADGDRVRIAAAASFNRRPDDTDANVDRLRRQFRALVGESGLPRISEAWVEAGTISVPEGFVQPSPAEALGRLICLSLLKLPFLGRGGRVSVDGRPLVDLDTFPVPPVTSLKEEPRQAVPVLPGGVQSHQETLNVLVDWVAEAPRSTADLEQLFSERFEIRSPETMKSYKNGLAALGLFAMVNETWSLTAEGDDYRQRRDPQWLFDYLAARFLGFEETLAVIADRGPIRARPAHDLVNGLLGVKWTSINQVSYRRNWLLSLGLTERREDGDRILPAGRTALERHGETVEGIRERLAALHEGTAIETHIEEGNGHEAEPVLVERVDLLPGGLRPHLGRLAFPEAVLASACAALSAGHHLLLVGPPGNGKTELAMALGKAARTLEICTGLRSSTATADWSTFETIGGYALEPRGAGQALVFRPGVFLQALEAGEWLLIDELNRGDVDRAFGELMTVLSGKGVVLPYRREDGRNVSIGRPDDPFVPRGGFTHPVPPTFRVIATMNTWDKTSLFRLSHALQRRFAILEVGIPDDATYRRLLRDAAGAPGFDPPLEEAIVERLVSVFDSGGLLRARAIGPAIALDIVRFLRRRRGADGFAEALGLYLLPQLEGLDRESARNVLDVLAAMLTGWATDESAGRFRARYLELFPELASSP